MTDTLREYRMLFERVPKGRRAASPKALGRRSKLGGKPTWEQHDETPTCSACGKEMIFVAQIDSIEHDDRQNPHRIDCLSRDQQYMFGDVGMIYVFFCPECLEARAVVQTG